MRLLRGVYIEHFVPLSTGSANVLLITTSLGIIHYIFDRIGIRALPGAIVDCRG